jgi:nucleoid DNA-binding protein
MNKSELIDKIAKDAKISKVQAGNALNSAIEGVT